MKITCLISVLCLISTTISSFAEDFFRETYFPRKMTFRGERYEFSQKALESFLLKSVEWVKEMSNKSVSEKDARLQELEREVIMRNLAFAVLAAAEFAEMTPEISQIFDNITKVFPNEPIPDGILTPEALFLGMAAQVFVNEDKQPPAVSVPDLWPGNFAMMVHLAREKINARGELLKRSQER